MLRLTPEIAKQLRALLAATSTEELIAVRETMPATSKKVDEAFLNFTRNNITALLKTRPNVARIEVDVMFQLRHKKQTTQARKTQNAIAAVVAAFPPRNAEDEALFAQLREAFL